MGTFEGVEEIPPDTIFGLTALFLADSRPNKVNLGVGVFRDESSKVPVLKCVQEAERRLAEEGRTKSYLPIDGEKDFIRHTAELTFGSDCPQLQAGRIYGAQSVGGSGALRVAGDFLYRTLGKKEIYLPDPSWANHKGIFSAAGLKCQAYPHYDRTGHGLAFEEMNRSLKKLPRGTVVLFHACCHNPTGTDPTEEQWKILAQTVKEGGLLPLFDCAYQGFAHTLERDAFPMRLFVEEEIELLFCYSYSKNLSLYGERVGALFILTQSPEEAFRVGSQVRKKIRENYSNPPAHGGRIVSTVLGDSHLRSQWDQEVKAMRDRIHKMRGALMEGLNEAGDFSFLDQQQGLFSFCGLSSKQTQELRDNHGLYMPPNGRINVTGLNQGNLGNVISALASVL